jgi:hypothetical protein
MAKKVVTQTQERRGKRLSLVQANRNGEQGYGLLKGYSNVFVTGEIQKERQLPSGPQYCFSSHEGMGLGEKIIPFRPPVEGVQDISLV